VFQRSSDHTGLVERFLNVFGQRGYTLTPSAPLTEGDLTVTFVNATVTPFKDRMAAGEAVGRTCQYQECLRAHGTYPWLYSFGMVGALVDAEHLGAVCADTAAALAAALGEERAARLVVLVDAADEDLTAALLGRGADVFVCEDPRIQSRWTYGATYPMAGRGATVVYRHRGEPCGRECRPDCECGRWQELGNIILISTPGRAYVEVGFGVEAMLSTAHGGQRYRIPEIDSAAREFVGEGWPPADACELVNLYRAVDRLTVDGAVPGPRGPGSVLRRFLSQLELLHAANPLVRATVAEYAAGRGARPALVAVLEAEAARREKGRRRQMASAAALLRRFPHTTEERLRETFGLSAGDLREVRHG
jgi:hypothetical protein